jgi:hypothetical protein
MLSFIFSFIYFLINMALEHSHSTFYLHGYGSGFYFNFFPFCDFFPYTSFEIHIALEHRRFYFSGYGSGFFLFFSFFWALF